MDNCDEELETVAGSVIRALTTFGMLRAPASAKRFPGTCSVGAATGTEVSLLLNGMACAGGCAKELKAVTGGETSALVPLACAFSLTLVDVFSEASLPEAVGVCP
jgi:hypothetical protein